MHTVYFLQYSKYIYYVQYQYLRDLSGYLKRTTLKISIFICMWKQHRNVVKSQLPQWSYEHMSISIGKTPNLHSRTSEKLQNTYKAPLYENINWPWCHKHVTEVSFLHFHTPNKNLWFTAHKTYLVFFLCCPPPPQDCFYNTHLWIWIDEKVTKPLCCGRMKGLWEHWGYLLNKYDASSYYNSLSLTKSKQLVDEMLHCSTGQQTFSAWLTRH